MAMASRGLFLLAALTVISQTASQESNDGWGPWSAPSTCSRTCGVGVTFQTRQCFLSTPAGIPQCTGSSKIYRTCNKQPCAEGTDFRKDQCQKYNKVTFEGKLYTWVPYYGGENPCELNCLAVGEKFYYRHAPKVVDGTACGLNTPDICVDGACQMIGCDGELGSSMLWDKCHVCGGDGSSCKTLEGVVYTDDMTVGYNDVVLIPAGATSISIIEEKASDSYLAIRDLSGKYLLNGDWHIDLPLPKVMAGATFMYERGSNPSAAPERVTAVGPIAHAIFFVVLRQPRNNTAIRYEYSIPNEVKQDQGSTYLWNAGEWQSCSATCGKGIMERQVVCKRSTNQEVVNPDLCDPHRKPEESRECEIRGCPASTTPTAYHSYYNRWYTGDWGFCSTTCGRGVQTRPVYCKQQQDEILQTIVDDSMCTSNKPPMVQACNKDVECPKWEVGEWSKCNKVCGEGEQKRSVFCRSPVPIPNAVSDIFPESRCDAEERPESKQTCSMGPCEGVDWVVSDWSGCSSSCEATTETRHVVCSSKSLKMFDEEMCDLIRKPVSSRPCPQSDDCASAPRWHASQWSKCSAKCGKGYQFRNVLCAKQEGEDILTKVEEDNCNADQKMNSTQDCYGENCAGLWFQGPWGKCSEPCGGGQRKREVLCFSGSGVADSNDCSPNSRPDPTQDCNLEPCDEDNLLVVGGCKGTRHGCCPDGITAAEGPAYDGCPIKDPIPAGLCVETDYGCCPDGLTPAQGPFLAGCPSFTCKDTLYGCCKDGQTPAGGPNQEQCPVEYGCDATAFGCCDDGATPANGPNKEGCQVTEACRLSAYGCCPDGKTAAQGPANAGCDVMESSGEVCEETQYGCCADGVTAAVGPNEEGCNEVAGCSASRYGCCPDGVNIATGDNFAGCPGVVAEPSQSGCAYTIYGCCPDGEIAALGQNGEGCHGIVHVDCLTTTFGCCPDQETIALGPNYEGCSTGCEDTVYGCCQDGKTPSEGRNYEGCDEKIIVARCEQTAHGCCPDRQTPAQGPNFAGCNITRFEPKCDVTTHGCCPDGQTVASGPNFEGCSEEGSYQLNCGETPYGCCPDQSTPAQGPNNAGCPAVESDSAACGLPSEAGPCRNFSVKWFYDAAVGGCNRFWYGGCDGNNNRFETQEECKTTCVSPPGIGKCHLPKSVGTCQASTIKYFYNRETRSCEQFSYGGCQGNANRFDSEQECRQECVAAQAPDVCSQPSAAGPCRGGFERWFFDKQAGECRRFLYGGCKGNDNRFELREACQARCAQPSTEVCSLPQVAGPCKAAVVSWYFNSDSKRCEQFIYGGCRGNANRFPTREECETKCHELRTLKEVDVCRLPEDEGPCRAYMRRWRYDPTTGYCTQFVYGGCQGNGNRFETEAECRQKCNARPPTDVCTLPSETGGCANYVQKYYFDQAEKICRLFYYGGCDGNGNNFETIQECQKTCAHHVPTQAPTVPSTAAPTQAPTQPLTQPTPANRCKQQKDPGPCLAYLVRWYYNEENQRCEQFIYGGCQGNRNRFAKMEECQAACMGGEEEQSTPVPASGQTGDQEICSLPRASGSCEENIPSWYFDTKEKRCVQFVYGGCEGNENRFETKADCERMCSSEAVCLIEKDSGDCGAYQPMWYYDTLRRRCERFVYSGCGGNGNRFENQEDCERRCQGAEERPQQPQTQAPTSQPRTEVPTPAPVTGLAVCALPTETGPCRKSEARWTYDVAEGRCKEFVYGGCRGNGNNFRSREECEAQCPVEGICQLPYEVGPCRALKPRFFYDTSIGQCRQFRYGGCQGNANRFLTEKTCQNTCMRETEEDNRIDQDPSQPEGGESDQADVCNQHYDSGPCEGYNIMYYYDTSHKICHHFVYGGCDGNSNRFQTKEECQRRCEQRATEQPTQPKRTERPYPTRPQVTYTPYPNRPQVTDTPYPTRSQRTDVPYPTRPQRTAQPYPSQPERTRSPYPSRPEETDRPYPTRPERTYRPYPSRPEETDRPYPTRPRVTYTPYPTRPQRPYPTRPQATEDLPESTNLQPSTLAPTRQEVPTQPPRTLAPRLPSTEIPYPQTSPSDAQPEIVTPGSPAQSEDVCQMDKDPGNCADYTALWYFERNSKACRQFWYGGCEGNGNRFNTRDECVSTCFNRPTPGPGREQGIRTAQPPTRPPRTRPPTPVRRTTPIPQQPGDEEVVDICSMPKEVGPCQAFQTRWHFDDTVGRCVQFNYGGCGSNANNFHSEEDCRYTCGGPEPEETAVDDQCRQPRDPGPCRADLLRYFFDEETKECRPFIFGGCQGNTNNFETSEECYNQCDVPEDERRIQTAGDCFNPPDAGPCDIAQPRWFFDPSKGDCAAFYYGGCQGNGNNFHTYEDCLAMCSKVTLTCGVLQCDLQCASGYARGQDGCPICSCEDPCVNVQCAEGERCEVESESAVCKPIPEEEPSIDTMGKTEFMVIPGGDVILPCKARGAPRPQVTWYKDNFPLVNLNENEQLSQLADGSLQIREVNEEMATSFTCRAYNGIGEPATQTYRVRLEEEVGFLETPSEITVQMGETAHMFCEMRGSPPPPRRWLRNEQEIQDTTRVFTRAQRELIIMQARPSDQGSYICQANGPDGNVITKTFSVVVLGPLTVRIETHNDTFGVGAEINLKCSASGDGDIRVQWTREDVDIVRNPRFVQTLEGDLMIRSSTEEDAGMYKCTATRGRQTVSASTLVRIEAGLLPESCEDKPWLANCQLIVEARLCKHPYFSNFCCRSCHEAGHLP